MLRLGHTLDKMGLPLGYVEEVPVQVEQIPPRLAIMDIEEPTPASLSSMPSFPIKKSTTSSLSMPSFPIRKRTTPAASLTFNRVLNGGKSSKILDDAMNGGKSSKILDDAMEFVAPLAQAKGVKGTTQKKMKTTKMAVKGNPEPAPIKKKAMKAKTKLAKKAQKTTATPNGESLIAPQACWLSPQTPTFISSTAHSMALARWRSTARSPTSGRRMRAIGRASLGVAQSSMGRRSELGALCHPGIECGRVVQGEEFPKTLSPAVRDSLNVWAQQ